ncbi:MAG: iron(III) transport system substrate-binding protein [Porticoccaceae bacterium]|jgi:iron(III) transport system substrate-binding protein
MKLRNNRAVKSALVILAPLLISFAPSQAIAEEVNVYSYRQPFLTDPIFDAFTAETGIKVNTVFAKKGLIERLENEGANSPADLVLVTNVGNLAAAVEAGITQPVSNDVLESNIPASFRDVDGHWFGLTSRGRIIVTSKDRIEEGLISDYSDLATPELKGKICTRSGKHSYMVELIASVIAHEGEEAAKQWLQSVKGNLARKPQGNDRAQVKAISQGECDVAIINTYYMGAMMTNPEQQAWADSVNIVFPNQSGRGTHMNISGVVMTKPSPNRDNAVKLMEFLANDAAQSMYATNNHEYPIKADVSPSELVSSWGEFKKDDLSLNDIAKYRAQASRLVDIVDYDG